MTRTFLSGYMDQLFRDPDHIVGEAQRLLSDVDFDTIVARGISGTVAAAMIAREMRKDLLIVRKGTEGNHGCYSVEGILGRKWLFVDDFISSGKTLREVYGRVKDAAGDYNWDTEFVGSFLYLHRSGDGAGYLTAETSAYEASLTLPPAKPVIQPPKFEPLPDIWTDAGNTTDDDDEEFIPCPPTCTLCYGYQPDTSVVTA